MPTPDVPLNGLRPDVGANESVFSDFIGRLRPNDPIRVAPSGQVTRLAVGGACGSLVAAVLVAILPSVHSVDRPFYAPARHFLQTIFASGHAAALPLAVFALLSLLTVAVVWYRRIPALVATYFLVAQPWVGVVVTAVALLAWFFSLAGFLACLLWALVVLAIKILILLFAVSVGFGILTGWARS